MSAPRFQEQADETIVFSARRHWMVFAREALAATMFALVPFFIWYASSSVALPGFAVLDRIGLFISEVGLLAWWIAVFSFWTDYWLDIVIITTRRIFLVRQVGLFDRQAVSWPVEDAREIGIRAQSPAQSLLSYGTVEIKLADGSFITLYDIPRPERIQTALQERFMYMKELEETAQRQKELLRTVAHEVKGYLTRNAFAFASIVEGDYGTVPEKLERMAGSALEGTRAGVRAVTDMLSGSATETGAAALRTERFDLREEARRVVERSRPAAEGKGLALEYAEDPQPCFVEADKEKLRERVLRNLIENAINYTKEGRISVAVTAVEGAVVFSVQDTGVGITPDDMQKLFTEGGRGAHSQEVNPDSTGFGLFAAKKVVDAHGGRIWAESDGPGMGARFYAALPAVAKR